MCSRFFLSYPIALSYHLYILDICEGSFLFLLWYARLDDDAVCGFFPLSFSKSRRILLAIHILHFGLHGIVLMLLLLFFYTNILKLVDENGLLMLYYSLNNFLFDTLFLVVLKHYIILEVVFLYFVSPIYCNITPNNYWSVDTPMGGEDSDE